jgi:hypothetical protein
MKKHISRTGLILLAALGVFVGVLNGQAVEAGWTTRGVKTDRLGRIVSMDELHKDGRVKFTTSQYHGATRVKMWERVQIFGKRGWITSITMERHDQFGRVTFTSSEVMDEATGRMLRGTRQYFTYRNDADKTGTQRVENWDEVKRRWPPKKKS